MSTYQCNKSIHETIAIWNDKRKGLGGINGDDIRHNARMLWSANSHAVVARYGEENRLRMVGPMPATFDVVDLSNANPLQIFKACNELRYQLMETDGYETSMAWQLVDAVREHAIYMIMEKMELMEALKAMNDSH
jgi:hypothetical protein